VFENRVLRRIFLLKWDGVMEGWRKLHTEELHDLYSSPSVIRIIKSKRMRWGGACGTDGREEERVYVIGRKSRWKETTSKIKT
jgi:hypothetical protein